MSSLQKKHKTRKRPRASAFVWRGNGPEVLRTLDEKSAKASRGRGRAGVQDLELER